MKQTLLITALFLFCLSCNNRTGEATAHANAEPLAQKITTDPIVGTWRMVSFSYNSEFSAGELLGKISAVGKDIGDVRITFHPDGTSTNNGQKFIVEFTTTIGGHSTTKNIPTKPDFSEGTWRREGNMLVVFNPKNPVDIGEQKFRSWNLPTPHCTSMENCRLFRLCPDREVLSLMSATKESRNKILRVAM